MTDEPFYGYYLAKSGVDHPGREQALAAQPHDWQVVVKYLLGPVPGGRPVWYMKLHAHQILPTVRRDWLSGVTNCFLIRHPALILRSYGQIRPSFDMSDLGLTNLREIFEQVRAQHGRIPPVVEASDLQQDPERILRALCDAVGVKYQPTMLSWQPGSRSTDLATSQYWYAKVNKTSCFLGPGEAGILPVPESQHALFDECMDCYEALFPYRLR